MSATRWPLTAAAAAMLMAVVVVPSSAARPAVTSTPFASRMLTLLATNWYSSSGRFASDRARASVSSPYAGISPSSGRSNLAIATSLRSMTRDELARNHATNMATKAPKMSPASVLRTSPVDATFAAGARAASMNSTPEPNVAASMAMSLRLPSRPSKVAESASRWAWAESPSGT